ncbi:sensor domain-containing diguanylate cyclase [Evansella cellulosilytica]|uniref:Diguanylate cyclase n=1 Tax=Evansella cellulosilytica (strain ATCC 21833 / DSM 2522 / FERM P-1141 / JCM 9156 / N-4) TaxID=649639 RepID=E6U113_EVAC2|nr:sensor domain-containing diguanylate cyclase [Evansella cellulosilytica]ADU30325.1 diguanylate cyclase [Evansella cellulosilytica DSM 2522]
MNEVPSNLLQALENDITQIAILYDISMIVGINDRDHLMSLILDKATRTLSSDMAVVILKNNHVLEAVCSRGVLISEVDRLLGDDSLQSDIINLCDNVQNSHFVKESTDGIDFAGTKYATLLFQPIKSQGHVLGVIIIGRLLKSGFNREELKLFSLLAQKAYVSLENIKLREEVYLQSITDALTGLYNFRYIESKMSKTLQDAEERQQNLTLVLMDFLHFKDVNDRLGHKMGNHVLAQFGSFLREQFPENDCCRIGGDEFLIVFVDKTLEEVKRECEKIKSFVHRKSVKDIISRGINFGVDVGFSRYREDGYNYGELYKVADARMYEDKAKNKREQ